MANFAMVMLITLIFILGLIGGLIWVSSFGERALRKQDPEKLLAGRFARGEIDEAEYARRLAVLRYGPPLELPD